MIYLWSATPGTGKTCYVVKQLIDNWLNDEKNKNRKIYANIAGLKIDGIYTPPDDFRDCEDGALIIYDEAQDIKHYSSETRDDPVARALSKHRHRGFDIHFITQDPALLNKWVLKNVFLHYYLWRPAQRDSVEIFTFARAIVTPTKEDFKNAFDKRFWRFETKYLEYYKSTVVNTSQKIASFKMQSTIGMGILFFGGLFVLMSLPAWVGGDTTDPQSTTQNAPEAPKQPDTAATPEQSATLADSIKITEIDGNTPLDPELMTKEQLQKQLALQEKHFNFLLEKQRLELIMQYDELQKRLLEHDKQMQDFYARLELYKKNLPKNYEIIKNDPALQVRAVVQMGNKCKAYNTHGDLMTLSLDECKYYLQAPGRVHKSSGQTTHVKADPVAQILTENPTFGATKQASLPQNAPEAPKQPDKDIQNAETVQSTTLSKETPKSP